MTDTVASGRRLKLSVTAEGAMYAPDQQYRLLEVAAGDRLARAARVGAMVGTGRCDIQGGPDDDGMDRPWW